LAARFKLIDRSPENLDGIFMTHEHSDHLKGIGPLARKFGIPVYSTLGAHKVAKKLVGEVYDWRYFKPLDRITINDLEIEAYPTPHDAADPVAFVARCNGFTLGQATDLGCLTPMVLEKMSSADALLLEANHDVEMLEVGPYPWSLKQRVKSDSGHLSNKACAELVSKVSHDALRILVIMHISEKNNHPDIVKVTVKPCIKNSETRFVIAEQSRPTELFCLC
jgi:phosphoribosyl 1,2-cyclic phosphodiesterase